MRIFPLQLPHLLVVSLVCVFSAAAFDGTLKSDGGTFSAPGKQEIEVTFPGAAQLYLEPDRHTFRPQRATTPTDSWPKSSPGWAMVQGYHSEWHIPV